MAEKRKRTGTEWVGGLLALPAYVTGEGEPYRPEVLLWVGSEGAVLGHTMGLPGELVGQACGNLRDTIEHPMFGRPHAPSRVRVASPELAEALRAGFPELEIVCAPTPEIDAVLAAMRDKMNEDAETEQSYLSHETDAAAVAAFFRAAAQLFRAQPWKVVPDDESLLSVTIDGLDVSNAVLSVIGQMGESLGFILFGSLDDFEAYVEAAEAIDAGETPTMPPHLALSFDRRAELSAARRKEIAQHRWEVAGPRAYPWVVAVDKDIVGRPPTARELAIVEAIARALPELLEEKYVLLAAWTGGPAVERTVPVRTHGGELEVTLRVLCERPRTDYGPPYDVIAALAGLAPDELDPDVRGPLEEELVRRFSASPEAKSLTDIGSCRYVMDLAADHFGATIATLGPEALREIIFDLIPRKVSIEASGARWIIDENRAFFAFLEHAFGFEQAGACRRVLEGDAVKKLEAALSDPRKFGMAKSLFMGGFEAGFDMRSKEGIEAWMRVAQSRPLPPSVRLPSAALGPQRIGRSSARPAGRTPAGKRQARKAIRKVRQKNR